MGDDRHMSEGAGEERDCPAAELWAEAVNWLGELMYQVVMGEPYEDEGDFLSNNPCDRLWAIGRDFDVALATLIVDSVVSDSDPHQVAQMYLDGLVPPEWSACGRFLKEGLAEGDFHDIGIEIAPDMTTALQRLVNDIPIEAWGRWGEISTEHPEEPAHIEMDGWLEGLEKSSDLGGAIRYIAAHPPHFWVLGWKFDREMLRCLAIKVAYCEESRELERLIDALDVPFTATTESLISRSALRRSEFLKLCEPEDVYMLGPDELAWAEAITGAVCADEVIRNLEERRPDPSFWEKEHFDSMLVHIFSVKGYYAAPYRKLKRILDLLDPPESTELRRSLEGRIKAISKGRVRACLVIAIAALVLLMIAGAAAERNRKRERVEMIQGDIEEIQLQNSGVESEPSLRRPQCLDSGAQDAADRLYDMLDPEYAPTMD